MEDNEVLFINVSKSQYDAFIDKNQFLIKEINQYETSYPSPYFYLGKEYRLPYRMGYTKNQIGYEDSQQEILKNCLLTRHHNGFVREQAVKNLIELCGNECPLFVYPFIVRLLGEYVKEIWDIIYNNRYVFYSNDILSFIKENNVFMETNKARGITYWYEYYRGYYSSYKQTLSYQYFKWITEMLQ